MRIFILLGHPNQNTLSKALADQYESSASAAGNEVRRLNIDDLSFDPILWKGYQNMQVLEPDLARVQENLNWCEHFVLVYPNWWGSMPALLKGMWDRMFLPRFAFRMWKNRMGWDRMLKGRTARVFILCGNPPWIDRFMFGNYSAAIGWSILRFAGFKTRITSFGPADRASASRVLRWMRTVEALARRGR